MADIEVPLFSSKLGTVKVAGQSVSASNIHSDALLSDVLVTIRAALSLPNGLNVMLGDGATILMGAWNCTLRGSLSGRTSIYDVREDLRITLEPIPNNYRISVAFRHLQDTLEWSETLSQHELQAWLGSSSFQFASLLARSLDCDVLPPVLDSYLQTMMGAAADSSDFSRLAAQ